MQQELAQTIALQAIEWIAGHEELGPIFMGSTGTSSDDMAARAGEIEYQLSALEFLTMDDEWVKGFCDQFNHDYQVPMTARSVLAGPAEGHWT